MKQTNNMNKELLKAKLEALVANEAIKRDELGVAVSKAQVAREELANINKPKITEEQAVELAEKLCELFGNAMSEIDPSDLDVEFSLDYNNTIVVDCINGLGDMEPPEDEIHEVIASIFNINYKEDE